jgi:ABC-type glycerol-3-phosphate transport system permease component
MRMSAVPLPSCCARAVRLLALLITAPLIVGVLGHLLPHVATTARSLSPLPLHPSRGSPAQAFSIFTQNLRVVALPLLGAAALTGLSRHRQSRNMLRALLDAVLSLSLVANLTLLALSLAGYGLERLAPWLPHLPVEFAALAIALDIYLTARRPGALSTRALLGAAALCTAALALAAVIETYATPSA